MRILGLIPARGGSKGVPRKNIKLLQGKALIQYSIETALACPLIAEVLVSTDDEEIATISRAAGATVPFLRPAHLASDKSPTIDTVLHTLHFLEKQDNIFDAVCLLQPTVPFRHLDDLQQAILRFQKQGADSLISVREVPKIYHPRWVFELDKEKGYLKLAGGVASIVSRRQDLSPAYHRDGSVYLTRKEILLEQASLYGKKIAHHVMKNSPDINIDTPDDWQRAEAYLQNNTTSGND